MVKSPSQLYDLRSDTVTRPTPAMLEHMFHAKVGDDVYMEDPSVTALEQEVASLLGKEAALFVPSGTMANTIAIMVQTSPGDAVIVEHGAHCLEFEAGAAAALGGVLFRSCNPSLAPHLAVSEHIRPDNVHFAASKLLVIENTHNLGGGVAKTLETLSAYGEAASEHGLRLHCDGARLWNASVKLGVSEAALAAHFDSVSVCFSKGLGAPIGSALVSSQALIDKARKLRKRLGGGMRQAGYLAAAASYALRHHRERLAEDHDAAKQFSSAIKENLPDLYNVNYPETSTNMVYLDVLGTNAEDVKSQLKDRGVLINVLGKKTLRAVFHQDCVIRDWAELIAAFRYEVRLI